MVSVRRWVSFVGRRNIVAAIAGADFPALRFDPNWRVIR
jgi:hypothetical protein